MPTLEQLRHSAAHLLAHALTELFPDVQLTIGPATEDGFFYDFLLKHHLSAEELPAIEKKMKEIADRHLDITHTPMPKNEARQLYHNNPFKLELIDGIKEEHVGIARQGNFYDLCKGGHVPNTSMLTHFILTHVSGSYWRADRNNPVLQRIYGTAFFTQDELEQYRTQKELALLYDHRTLGKQLDLFSFHQYGPGFPFFHPKGKTILLLLTEYIRNLLNKNGYLEVETPLLLSDELWKQSGHYEHYQDYMYFCSMEKRSYALRPMNCPGSILLYQERPRTYKDLPLRLAEFGKVHRYELSGVLHGLFRTRAFTTDDGHIFCTEEHILDEVQSLIKLIKHVFHYFNFTELHIKVATRPDNAMGDPRLWEEATKALYEALDFTKTPYTIAHKEGAFYGPKIEFHIKDSIGRSWQCGTIQIDFFQSLNFNLNYTTADNSKKHPIIIHRAIYGSLERFFGILIEHFRGKLPFWLSPVQAKILPILEEQHTYAHHIRSLLTSHGIRTLVDTSTKSLSGQIKTAQQEAVPLMIIVGKKEAESHTVTLRLLNGKQLASVPLDSIIDNIQSQFNEAS
ncbi:MAG: threonine--tRNA ligase [Candidatus Babeliales bacterium]